MQVHFAVQIGPPIGSIGYMPIGVTFLMLRAITAIKANTNESGGSYGSGDTQKR